MAEVRGSVNRREMKIMNVSRMITEGHSKGGVNEPPTTPRPPAPVGYRVSISSLPSIEYVPKDHMDKVRKKLCQCGYPTYEYVMVQLCENGIPVDKYIQMKQSTYDQLMRKVIP